MDLFGGNEEKLFSVFEEQATPDTSSSTNQSSPSESTKKRKRESEKDVESQESSKKTNSNSNTNDKSTSNQSTHGKTSKSQTPEKEVSISIADQIESSSNSTSEITGESSESVCLHEVCFPPEDNNKSNNNSDSNQAAASDVHDPPFPVNPARTWKFTLDPFQRMSIACIERGDSVLVSAHTSAGKTVVAEYAIALSLKSHQRVIYTSPIKALSNQKYRELYEIFSDVGLMTGDITINPSASCIVMTTEILRSMLYRGSEIMREVAWVIFDEIHYMRDKERGVVWEETIILLPDKVRYVFLSATIPNAKQFASWVAKLHSQICHVVYTDVRPTPLQHYIFPAGGEGLHLVVDEKGNFREDNFQKALATLSSAPPADRDKKKQKQKGGGSDIYNIVKMIMDKNYEPVIVFSFSKKDCEALALQMAKLDLNNDDEKRLVEEVFSNAIDALNEDDKKLPQVLHILPLLKRGIGIHHSGLLPILKEVIEILFQEGLIKALFATETFAMGLNMPAKTVVFTNVRKFDGHEFRWISSGEYIQMSGRAGRRGLDDRGIVILMVDQKMEPPVAKNMLKGLPDPLNSSFYIGYNMLLNLMRTEQFDPEMMLKKSFHQYQADANKPKLLHRVAILEDKKNAIASQIKDEQVVAEYYQIKDQINKLRQLLRSTITQPVHCLPYLQPGRLVRVIQTGSSHKLSSTSTSLFPLPASTDVDTNKSVTDDNTNIEMETETDWGWGVVVNFQKKQEKPGVTEIMDNQNTTKYIVDVLLNCAPMEESNNSNAGSHKLKPASTGSQGVMQVVPILLELVSQISSIRLYIPKDLRSLESRQSVGLALKEVQKRFADGVPALDPIEDMKIDDPNFKKAVRKIESLEEKIRSNSAFTGEEIEDRYNLYCKKLEIENQIKVFKKSIKQSESVILKHELKCMKRVLRRLGYANSEDIIDTKGRVACEINAADELVITELIFSGVFNDLEPEVVAALLTCFVFQEKVESSIRLKEELNVVFRKLQETAKHIAQVSSESKIPINVEEYVQKFSPHMMDVTLAWAKGAKFSEICNMTNIFEGSIIRCMRRLEELLRQLCAAGKSIGNSQLENKFAEAINKIKRDIVFAASLYL